MGILKTGFKSGTWEPVIIGTLSPMMTQAALQVNLGV